MYISNTDFTEIIDKLCIEKYGIPEIVLMENAANVASRRIINIVRDENRNFEYNSLSKKVKIMIFCGVGNNGGDGFAISRLLANEGYSVSVIVVGNLEKMTPSSKINYNIVKNMDIEIFHSDEFDLAYCISVNSNKNIIIIDSIFGVGLNRNIEGKYKDIIEGINLISSNNYNVSVISIDIPSGLDGTTGEIKGISVKSDYTITFEYYKNAFLRYDLERIIGCVYVEKIGVPSNVYKDIKLHPEFISQEYISNILIDKNTYSHKGDFGKVCIFAGSKEYSGAAYLSTRAAVRTGSGLTTLISTKEIEKLVVPKFKEEMYCSIDDIERVKKLLDKSDSIGFGPGYSYDVENTDILRKLIKSKKSIVIDADGIDMLGELINENIDLSNCVITPHLAEFSRLSGYELKDIQQNRILFAEKYSRENNLVVVLKGKNTIITNGDKTMVNTTGNYSMANGGMGDVLTGIITSLIGQGYDIFNASCLGVYLHGLCADLLFENQEVVNASDILEILPKAIRLLKNVNKVRR